MSQSPQPSAASIAARVRNPPVTISGIRATLRIAAA